MVVSAPGETAVEPLEGADAHRSTQIVEQAIRASRHRPRPKPQPAPVSGQLAAIAECESHGNPRAIGGGGAYRGKYQFSYSTWRSVGGKGDPAAAPEAEQDRRAAMLLARDGAGHWPVCG